MSFLLCGAGFNLLGGPPPLLLGARRPRVRHLPGSPVACFWLVPQVRVSGAVLCCSVPRRVASCCRVLRFGVPCRGALHCGTLRCSVPCCLVLCRGGSVEVSLDCVLVRSAGRSVAGWWLGGALRCGWLAGSVLWGPGCAARVGRSGRCLWNCPPWGPLPWSCVLWGSQSLALGTVAVPSSSTGACEVALVVAGVWPGGEGVVVGCAAVSPAASSVCVAHLTRADVPSILCVVSGGWWVCAGVIRTASNSFFGGACCGCAPPGVVRHSLGVGQRWSLCRGMPFLGVGPGACRGVLFLCASVPAPAPSWSLVSFLPPRCVASGALSLWALAPHLGPLCAPLPECPFSFLALPLPVPFPFPVWFFVGWGGGANGPGLGVGGLEPLAEGLGGVGGAEALDRVEEEGLPCRLRHDGLRGGLLGVGGSAGADLLEGVHHVHPFSPSRSPGPLHPVAELLQSGGRPPGEVGGGLGGGR